jgi:hypothetical protein
MLLLLTASIATRLVWENFAVARDGDAAARVAVFLGAPVALVSFVLLARIVTKVRSARHGKRES